MFQSIGPTELIIVAVIVLLLFGGKRIPEFFKGLGDAVREFKKASKDSDEKEKKE
ncbi:MAG: twin-arginine translocase TatA/TatE family subunit [Candidatus Woesebacteria bacterium]|nr:MAG: twin-arginine translocase TatA/TatE family subunit [Candidatus Woesebacteria bacterium]